MLLIIFFFFENCKKVMNNLVDNYNKLKTYIVKNSIFQKK